MTWQLGPYQLPNKLILAPMAGVTDTALRNICYQQGAGYAIGEMLSAQTHLWATKKSATRQVNPNDPEPRAVQLLGIDPLSLADAAQRQVEQGAQVIDLNMGCPAKKVCQQAAGSALLAYPEQVAHIFKAVTAAVKVPVTVKIRTGIDSQHKNALEIARIAEDCGLSAIAIHGRTRADKFNGHAEYDTIAQIKQSLSIPVIANGDICSAEQAQFVLNYTHVDALMLGRAVLGRPWLFNQINTWLNHKTPCPAPNWHDQLNIINAHLAGIYQLYGEKQGVRIARKHLGWYAQFLPQGALLRQKFNQLNESCAQQACIYDYFDALDTRLEPQPC
ncbi:tRNA dihydrouridine synthase DusB [Thiomicrospira sp. ALE5]|uniref:tRNA dihydrouridine synthase DusB n=1 Tax=Thiomicrospira sp. ALE5 TaxID=748650 RepID=UPI000B87D30A|nr:tRNA dihydrouridine synthase DusB [Thiomicrospira sp. ALE5]